jgi:hypothetical protein
MRRALRLTLILFSVVMIVAGCRDADDLDNATGEEDVLTAVTASLEARNGWEPGSATVTLDGVEDGRFAHGGVTDPAGSGARWFASLEDGDWEIVWDGNGIADCALLEPYGDFPVSLLPQCIDASGNLQSRQ